MSAGDRPDPIMPRDDKDLATNLLILLKRIRALETESDRIKLLHP
jgi:hypothetical protein